MGFRGRHGEADRLMALLESGRAVRGGSAGAPDEDEAWDLAERDEPEWDLAELVEPEWDLAEPVEPEGEPPDAEAAADWDTVGERREAAAASIGGSAAARGREPGRTRTAGRVRGTTDAGGAGGPRRGRRGRHVAGDSPPGLISWPLGLRDRMTGVPHPVVLAFLVLSMVAGSLFGVRVVRAQAAAEVIPLLGSETSTAAPSGEDGGDGARSAATDTPDGDGGGAAGDASGATSAAGPGGGATGPAAIVRVHVVGQVARPGVVSVPAGSRVEDVVAAAGGATSKADLAAVNLARSVVDGEQIRVPMPGETLPPETAAPPPTSGGTGGTGASVVNINTADAGTLEGLPGVGPVLAQRILEWRAANGRFASADQLGEVSGIGEKLLAKLAPLVVV